MAVLWEAGENVGDVVAGDDGDGGGDGEERENDEGRRVKGRSHCLEKWSEESEVVE